MQTTPSFNLRGHVRAMLLIATVLFVVGFVAGMLGAMPTLSMMSKRFPELGRLPGSLALGVLVSGGISIFVCCISALFTYFEVVASKKDAANLEEAKSYFGFYVLSSHYLTDEGLVARSRLFFFFAVALVLWCSTAAAFMCIGSVFDL
ncbi:hypothetical protein ACQUJV_25340 [Ralstonia pseudosolanacearum]